MSFIFKCIRNFAHSKYRNQIIFINSIKCLQNCNRDFHNTANATLFARVFMEYENNYAYNILENKGYAIPINIHIKTGSLTNEEFQDILKEDWSRKTPSDIFNVFPKLGNYCSSNDLSISDKIFDTYIDNLTDSVKLATDEELELLFHSLNKWPEPESIRNRNFIEVWVALDDECMNRLTSWSHDKMLSYTTLFYMVNVIKYSDYCVKCLQRLTSKAKQLTPAQFVQTMFFIGVWRKQPFDVHNLEIQFNNIFSQFTIDDIAIISMGFFKSKTPIRDTGLVLQIINLMIDNAKDIHEVSLAALLKIIRYSTRLTFDDRIYRLLDALQREVPRLSVMCNVHVALVGTTTLTLHKQCLTEIADTVIKNISQCRVKDLERLVLTYGTFNLIPPTKECFFTKVMDELRKPERHDELSNYGRSFACCVAFLALLGIYPVDLITKVLSPEFLDSTYGKQCYLYGREILILNNISEIFCKDAKINRLSEKIVKILAKKYTDYVPEEDYPKSYNVTENMMLDVMKVLRTSRGGKEYVIADHILTHHQRGDVIVCNKQDGSPVAIRDIFTSSDFGLLRRPPDNNLWIVLVIAGRNAIIYNTHEATGYFTSKIKELKALGFHAALVPWSIYNHLNTVEEKVDFLNNLIDNSLKQSD